MATNKPVNDISREEDYRDYDTRNIDDGWPYADQAGAGAGEVENAAYGDPKANFDRERNKGYSVDNADADGLEEAVSDPRKPATVGVEESDDLEERVTNAIEQADIVAMETIDVRADGTTVTLEGEVDDQKTVQAIVATVRRVPGVGKVRNELTLLGIDTLIPDDD
ncbi:BON domain-containing protein [Rhizobium sp. SSA_523]|uniref:BON domain-containing protein n=1 Tax=Rhizobium sp. SSA_523 TaxID=2952477 RepID=UPI0020910427|nr:BON domain-containing protein [Rhizobium sp. SSA_523]MCO5733848.1 BON domain-containing protein [Rhizobium sp. SSA_523]WKC24885.1 BON domain-containing protein [Rhizobium sp. SSA_523]